MGIMNHLYACSNFSPKNHIAVGGRGCFTALQTTERPIHCIPDSACKNRKAMNCSYQRVLVISKIRNEQSINNRNCKLLERRFCVPVKFIDACASKSDDEDDYATSLKDVLFEKLHTIYQFIRPHVVLTHIVGVTSLSLVAIGNITDLTPTFFKELLKAVVPSALMSVYVVAINDLSDVEIDKINKPERALLSGDLSKGTAIAIVSASFLMSLAMGIMFKSPPQLIALLIHGLAGTVYSVDLPFLRWKKNPFLAATCMLILGLTNLFFFIHTQKYVLGRPIMITRSFKFATAFVTFFSHILALAKDLPDVDGDREHGVRTLSIILGKERVFWLCVQSLLMAYGAAIMFGVSSSLLPSKLVTILGHSMLAYFLWLGARSTDLSSNASIRSFYLLLFKLQFAEFLLFPFVR